MPLPARIRNAREQLRMSQQQLADAIGVDRSSVSNWERGTHAPTRVALAALERVLGSLSGEEDDLPSILDDIRNARALNATQRQVLLAVLGERPHGRHILVPALVNRSP